MVPLSLGAGSSQFCFNLGLPSMEPRFLRFFWLVLGALVLTFFLWPGPPENGPAHPQPVWDNFDAIRNETLGVHIPSRVCESASY